MRHTWCQERPVGLAFAGLSSGTLALLSGASRVAGGVVLVGLLAGLREPDQPTAATGKVAGIRRDPR